MGTHSHRLRIGVASPCGLGDESLASGTPHRIAEALSAHCGDVVDLGPLETPPIPTGRRICYRLEKAFTGRRPRWKSSRECCRMLAATLDSRLAVGDCDIVFSAFALWAMAMSQSDLPMATCTDATFPLSRQLGHYASITDVAPRSVRESMVLERQFLHRCVVNFPSSRWAAGSMVNDYGVPPDSIIVAPLGANLDAADVPDRESAVSRPIGDRCRLLFIGADWNRKGGTLAVQTLAALNEMGTAAELVIVGCQPPGGVSDPNMTVVGFLDKNDPASHGRMIELLLMSNFLFVPTRSEAYGIVFCEGNAFGLPAIATAVGGVTEIVRDGRNGYALDADADAQAYAERIAGLWSDRDGYQNLVRTSREEYETRLNWDAWGRTVAGALRRTLPEPLADRVGAASDRG